MTLTLATSTPRRLVISAVLAFLSVLSLHADPIRFNIPAQSAATALSAFSEQSGQPVMFDRKQVQPINTNAVVGDFEPNLALEKLVDGTGLISRRNSNGKFLVTLAQSKTGSVDGEVRDESGRPLANAKVDVEGIDQSVVTDKRGRFTLAEVPAGARALNITAEGFKKTRVTDVNVRGGNALSLSPIVIPVQAAGVLALETYTVSAKKNDGVVELDPYQVSGAKGKAFQGANVDIPRTIDDVQPYYVFDSKTIDQSGATNLEDFLKQRLTMNTTAQMNSQNVGNTGNGSTANMLASNTSSINLRGLGTEQTLILVNGRKLTGAATSSDNLTTVSSFGRQPGQVDLNAYPLSAVDRIEVLPTSASAIYGGGALGGVINVILKKNYTGAEVRLLYSNVFDSDAPTRSASLTFGKSFNDGKTQLLLSAQLGDSDPLRVADRRALYDRGLSTVLKNFPDYLFSTTVPYPGALPNIQPTSAATSSLTLKDGRSLNSRLTFVSAGTTPSTSTSSLSNSLLANAGSWNLELPPTSIYPTGLQAPITVGAKTKSFTASVTHQLFAKIQVSADFQHTENNSSRLQAPQSLPTSVRVASTAAINPFTTDVLISVPLQITTPVTYEAETDSATIGLEAKLPGQWLLQSDYTWSRNRTVYDYTTIDTTALNAATLAGTINPFVDLLQYPFSLSPYFGNRHGRFSSISENYAVRGYGPLLKLGWWHPNVAVGLQRYILTRPQAHSSSSFPITTNSSTATTWYRDSQTTDSAYLEADIPLVKERTLPFIRSLEVQVSGRNDRYAVESGTFSQQIFYQRSPVAISYNGPTSGGQPYRATSHYDSSNGLIGLKYEPFADITLRASVGTAFLPPSPGQLVVNPEVNPSTTNVRDPKRGNVNTAVQILTGGNPALKPQTSSSVNAGIIWAPSFSALKGMRVNFEYYKITEYDALTALTAQTIVTNESVYPDRVTRDAAGVITLVNTSLMNLYRRENEGFDISASYDFKTAVGSFETTFVESILIHNKNQYSTSLPAYDLVGFPSEGGAAKTKANGTIVWKKDNWTVGWATTYYGSYKQSGALGGPTATITLASGGTYASSDAIIAQGSDSLPSQVYHDIFVSYAFGARGQREGAIERGLLRDLTIQVGVKNIFDRWPAFDSSYALYASPYGDLRLRSYWISLKKSY